MQQSIHTSSIKEKLTYWRIHIIFEKKKQEKT